MDETKPYFVGPDTPLEISDNLRYVFGLQDANARLRAVAGVLETIADDRNWNMGGDVMYGSPLWDKHPMERAKEALAAVKDLL